MASLDPKQSEYLSELDDIISRYELDLPFTTADLLDTLEQLNNPRQVISFFGTMHKRIALDYGDHVAERVMPEISAVHSNIPRPILGGLTYKELETVLHNLRSSQPFPDKDVAKCQASKDMSAFLTYVRDTEPALTQKLKQINRKSVSDINALLVEPKNAVHDYGKAVFVDRDEHEFWKIRFLRSLAHSDHLVYTRNGRLHLSKRGAGWLKLDDRAKIESLYRSWCEAGDWSFWNEYFKYIAEVLQYEQLTLFQAILALDRKYDFVDEKVLDNVCATLCALSNEPDQYGHRPLSYASRNLIGRPMEYFGLADFTVAESERAALTQKTLS